MSSLRLAAQQALEALEAFLSDELRPYEAAKTATALRAALAEPDIDPVDEYRKGFIAGQIDMRDRLTEQQEPVQEPVRVLRTLVQIHADGTETWREDPVWSAPPQRKPLTDEEIEDLYFDKFSMGELNAFARAIERAHGIGE